jgi:predicted extracellular nuclease
MGSRVSSACPGRLAANRRLRLSVQYTSLLVLSLLWFAPQTVRAVSTTVVISEFRVRGPNGGSDEFVELYNLTSSPVDISGWKLKGSNNSGTVSVRATVPSGKIIPAHGHYLFTNSSTAGGPYSGSVPGDETYATGITDDGGIAITLPDDTIVDQAGLSSGSAYQEGTPLASLGTSNLDHSYERKPGGAAGSGQDSDNNSADFQLIAPSDPQNTSSAPSGLPTNPTGTGSASPSTVAPGGTTFLTVQVTPGQNPASSGIAVATDLSPIGGLANQPLFDDGSNGDVTAADRVFSYQATVRMGTTPGAKTIPAAITDTQGRTGSTGISLTIQSDSIAPGAVVISQIYGGGGNSGAVFKNDFVELFNRSSAAVNVAGWSVQYASATGTSWQKTDLSGTIPPGRYLLIQEASGSGGTVNLTPDVVGSISMAAGAGKVALVSTSIPLSAGCPTGSSVIDFAGYGSNADCFEGAGPTPAPGNTTAAMRRNSGCIDSDNNAADFLTGTPNPRNSGAPFNSCILPPVPTLTIHDIQGSGLTSPHVGATVQTTVAIVTAVKSNGFFIQTPDTDVDSDANTSEGVFVFTGSTPPAAAAVGNAVAVTGRVAEFIPSADPASPPLTEISGAPTVALISTGNPLPLPLTLTSAATSPTGAVEQLERFEGMRVHVDSLTAFAPTQGSVSEANATSTSSGVFYAVITGVARPFREPGVQVPDPLPPGSPGGVPRFDANPERLRVDSGAQIGSTKLEVTSCASITSVTGVLDFSFRTYSILTDPVPVPAVTGNLSAQPVPDPTPDQFTVASFNTQRFFDTVNDPGIDDVALNPTAFNNRLNKASLAIRDVMKSPDVIGVEEVENLATLQALATKVNNDAVAAGKPNPLYLAALVEGNDIGGIDAGLLVKSSRVIVMEVIQEGKDATYINPRNGQPELLNDRPPLILRASIPGVTDPHYELTVIVNHLRSLSGIDDPADGARVRAKRRAQAEFLANLVQARQRLNPGERIVLVGDFNAFQFNDGYVDTIGTIKGTPAPAGQVVLASPALVNPVLTNLVDAVPAAERYSYSFDGNAQVLDHILVNHAMLPSVRGIYYARSDADFPESLRSDPRRPERVSDHDMPVAYFTLDVRPPLTTPTIAENSNANGWYTSDVHVTLNAVDHAGGAGVQSIKYSLTGASIGGGTVDAASLPLVLSAEGITTLKYYAVDPVGNVESTHTLVIKIDKAPPSLACPQSIAVEASGSAGATVNYPPANASDTASWPHVGYSKTSGTVFPIGISIINVTATDEAGNGSTCSFTVTVRAPTTRAVP